MSHFEEYILKIKVGNSKGKPRIGRHKVAACLLLSIVKHKPFEVKVHNSQLPVEVFCCNEILGIHAALKVVNDFFLTRLKEYLEEHNLIDANVNELNDDNRRRMELVTPVSRLFTSLKSGKKYNLCFPEHHILNGQEEQYDFRLIKLVKLVASQLEEEPDFAEKEIFTFSEILFQLESYNLLFAERDYLAKHKS